MSSVEIFNKHAKCNMFVMDLHFTYEIDGFSLQDSFVHASRYPWWTPLPYIIMKTGLCS